MKKFCPKCNKSVVLTEEKKCIDCGQSLNVLNEIVGENEEREMLEDEF